MTALPVVQEQSLTHDFSSLSTAASCLRKYFYGYVERLEEPEPNVSMKAGSAMHDAFAVLYGEAWDLRLAKEALRESYAGFRPPPAHKKAFMTIGHLEIVLENYVRDREENPTILEEASVVGSGVEGAVVFDWPNKHGELLRIGGKPDLPIQIGRQRFIVDHKTTSMSVNSWWAKGFRISHQFRIYCAMMEQRYAERFDGAYVNAVHMGENASDPSYNWKNVKSSPNRLFGPYNYQREHLDETWEWVRAWSEIIERCGEEGVWPQNERACRDYGGCEFLPLCELPAPARPGRAASAYRRWEPEGILLSGADSDD